MKTFAQLVEELKGTYIGVRFNKASLEMLKDLQRMYKIPDPTPIKDMHATVVYSRVPVEFPINNDLNEKVSREVQFHVFNTRDGKRALVLKIKSDYLTQRHELGTELGATYDFPDYIPHITLSYDVGDKNFSSKPFKLEKDLVIEREYYEDLNLNWKQSKD